MDSVEVSIWCVVYNHEKYLREALEGFIMQKTNFNYEVIIHDDASTDGSVDIIQEYERKYPDIIKPIYQKENIYSKYISVEDKFLVPRTSGKYIAICDGDDFWTDSDKLQKQYDFLEANPDIIATSHNVILIEDDGTLMTKESPVYTPFFEIYTDMKDHFLTENEIKVHCLYGQSSSRMYRNFWPELSKELRKLYVDEIEKRHIRNGDMMNTLMCFCMGKVWCSSYVGAKHRISLTGTSYNAKTRGKNKNNTYDVMNLYIGLQHIVQWFDEQIDFSSIIIKNTKKAISIGIHKHTKEDLLIMLKVIIEAPYKIRTFLFCMKYLFQKSIAYILKVLHSF